MPRCVSEEVYRKGKEFQAQGLSAFKAGIELEIATATAQRIFQSKDYEEYRTPRRATEKAGKPPKAPEAAPETAAEAKADSRAEKMVDLIRRCELFHMADGKVQIRMTTDVWESLF